MRLDQVLVERLLCESRTEAQELLALGHVVVDGVITKKRTKQIVGDEDIRITTRRKFVSRGGDKLEGALTYIYGDEELIRNHIQGRHALDIGSSTGGFTDCLLSYGVSSIVSVDVGTSQLHPRLRSNEKVTLFENTDIRKLPETSYFEVIVCDVSFISLEKIIDVVVAFGTQNSEFFLLLKPQFEVGKGNTKKGIVKDVTILTNIFEKYKTLLQEKGMERVTIFPCTLVGGDGNQEYFLYAKKNLKK
jgi:23S rRNA (cytidine1920-2'-O)/16S rRNA (cytidine1409-2'-O)-methyltransferase